MTTVIFVLSFLFSVFAYGAQQNALVLDGTFDVNAILMHREKFPASCIMVKNACIVNQDLANLKLSKITFYNVIFSNANFRKTSLKKCCFFKVKVWDSCFDGADLEDVIMRECSFTKSTFLRTDCAFAIFNRVIFENSIAYALFEDSEFFNVIVKNSDFSESSFQLSALACVLFQKAKLNSASFELAGFKDCIFDTTDVDRASFKDALFINPTTKGQGTNFSKAYLDNAVCMQVEIKNNTKEFCRLFNMSSFRTSPSTIVHKVKKLMSSIVK